MSLILGATKLAGIRDIAEKANIANPIFTPSVIAPEFAGELSGEADVALLGKNFATSEEGNIWIESSSTQNVSNADLAKAVTGNSATASKFATPMTITFSGDVSGSVSFDGTQDKEFTIDVVNSTNSVYALGVTSPTLTPLMNTPTTASFTLSQPYTNFKGLLIVGTWSDSMYVQTEIIWTWDLDLRRQWATTKNTGWQLFPSLSDGHWTCGKDSTTTSFTLYGRNQAIIRAVYGIN